MILAAREYRSDLIRGAEAGEFEPRAAIGSMEAILKIVRLPDAARCRTIHPVDFKPVWPRERLTAATEERLFASPDLKELEVEIKDTPLFAPPLCLGHVEHPFGNESRRHP
jgi:hypothetical protein